MKNQRRAKLLARVHIAKAALGLDDATYRAMLKEGWRRGSAADLADRELAEFCAALERQSRTGAQAPPSPGAGGAPQNGFPGRPKNMGTEKGPLLSKVEALLAEKGRVQGSPVPWSYADGIARNMFGIEKVGWCDPPQLRGVVAALMRDAQRHGRNTG